MARLHGVGQRGLSQSVFTPWRAHVAELSESNGKIKPYQARQLIDMIDKYEDEL